MGKMNSGTVSVEINGRTYDLAYSLGAIDAIERMGGPRQTLQRVQEMSFDAIVGTIAAGTGAKGKDVQRIRQDVLAAGIATAAGLVAEYLMLCVFGPSWRERDEAEGDDDEGNA